LLHDDEIVRIEPHMAPRAYDELPLQTPAFTRRRAPPIELLERHEWRIESSPPIALRRREFLAVLCPIRIPAPHIRARLHQRIRRPFSGKVARVTDHRPGLGAPRTPHRAN